MYLEPGTLIPANSEHEDSRVQVKTSPAYSLLIPDQPSMKPSIPTHAYVEEVITHAP